MSEPPDEEKKKVEGTFYDDTQDIKICKCMVAN